MIPKRIHYCWFGGSPLPREAKRCIESWKRFCPDYEIIEWNESNFDICCHPFVKSAYEAGAWAFVSDYARLKVVYENGGIYFDTDVELLRKPDFLLEYACYVGIQQCGRICNTGLGFGAEQGDSTIQNMLAQYDNLVYQVENREKISCPYINHRTLTELGYKYSDKITTIHKLVILPPQYLDPLSPGDCQNLLCEDSVSIHHYSASWTSKTNRWKRKIIQFVGEKRVHQVKQILKNHKKENLE